MFPDDDSGHEAGRPTKIGESLTERKGRAGLPKEYAQTGDNTNDHAC